jgi:[ribosomal protein S18]-alanine N-acetyltransferase
MSAQLDNLPEFRPMLATDLDRVMDLEPALYSHPWTRGNFSDSLTAGYSCWIVECNRTLAGYGVLMIGVREAHLLNLSVATAWQRRGYGRMLLQHFTNIARASDAAQLFLEVRPSNSAARQLYIGFGFRDITVRRGYYPAGRGREDAILMGISL